MAVYFYGEGDHPAGFIGFRAVTTIGDESYNQEYFSLSQYSYEKAQQMANDLNNGWRAEAEERMQERRLNPVGAKKTSIARGLVCSINIEKKMRQGKLRHYFTPCFVVSRFGDFNMPKTFRISENKSYEEAYREAVDLFCETRDLGLLEKAMLLEKMPDKNIFYIPYKRLHDDGREISVVEIAEKLGCKNLYWKQDS